MIRPLPLLILAAMATAAAANPQRCGDLAPHPYDKLSTWAQTKLPDGADWAQTKTRWSQIAVTIEIERAPHIARDILRACPGVVSIDDSMSTDPRNFRSQLTIRVASFAALTRLAQLPAISRINVYDTTRRIKHPMPMPMPRAPAPDDLVE